MRSKTVWRLNADKTIIEVQKGTSKLYANGAASVEYGLVCDFLTDEDVVVIVANREGNQYSQRLKRGLITYNDGTTEMGWKVISNGAELNFDLESGSAQIGFSFDIKRISQLDQVSVLEEYTSSTDNVEVYPSSKYYPQLDPSDEEMILHDIAVIEARLNRGDLEAKGIKQWIITFNGSTDPSGYYQGANIGDYYYNYAGDNLFVLERVVAMGQYWTKLEDSGTRGYNTNVVVYHAGTKTFYKSLTDNNIDYIPSANWQKLEVQDIIDLFAMIGDLEELTTTNKDNLVNAINEVDERSKDSEEEIADLEERVSQNEDGIADLQTDTSDKVDKVSGSSAISNESGTITLYTGHLISGGSNTSILLSNSLTKILSQQIGLANSNKSELLVDTSGITLKSLDNDSSTELKVTKQGATLNNEQIAVQSYVDTEISNLQDEVDNLKARGRFLSIWNSQTGLPTTNPDSLPYDYNTGDYFIVGEVTPNVTHYQPSGTQYTGSASTTIETREISVDDVYYFDGTSWSLQINTVDMSNKADKVSNATNGNFAALDSNGNLIDSTKKSSDFMSSSEKVGKNLSISGNTLSLKDQDSNTLGNSVTLPQTDVSGKEDKSNKVTSLSSNSTDTQYPSAKCVYDIVGNIVSLMEVL